MHVMSYRWCGERVRGKLRDLHGAAISREGGIATIFGNTLKRNRVELEAENRFQAQTIQGDAQGEGNYADVD